MFEPVYLETDEFLIHSFRPQEICRSNQLIKEILNLLSDDHMLRFIPEKRLNSLAQAENWLKAAILNFHCGRNYVHLITEKASGNYRV